MRYIQRPRWDYRRLWYRSVLALIAEGSGWMPVSEAAALIKTLGLESCVFLVYHEISQTGINEGLGASTVL